MNSSAAWRIILDQAMLPWTSCHIHLPSASCLALPISHFLWLMVHAKDPNNFCQQRIAHFTWKHVIFNLIFRLSFAICHSVCLFPIVCCGLFSISCMVWHIKVLVVPKPSLGITLSGRRCLLMLPIGVVPASHASLRRCKLMFAPQLPSLWFPRMF